MKHFQQRWSKILKFWPQLGQGSPLSYSAIVVETRIFWWVLIMIDSHRGRYSESSSKLVCFKEWSARNYCSQPSLCCRVVSIINQMQHSCDICFYCLTKKNVYSYFSSYINYYSIPTVIKSLGQSRNSFL